MEKNIKVIVAAHKKYQMPNEKMYIPVQVGAEGKEKMVTIHRGFQKNRKTE